MEQFRDAALDWLRRDGFMIFDPTDEVPEAVRSAVCEKSDPGDIIAALKARGDLDLEATAQVLFVNEDLMKLARERGIRLAEDSDWFPILRLAAAVAFGTFAEWPDDIAGLREAFKAMGASSGATAQFLLEDEI